ncbi:Uma2 family endonuclease [Micromonospora echinofusca]|uniref:Uma2 family endonuclease n=1 Tax=Micromonospora echinofusca TaxID=47858 RepID=A0ABS3VPI7_MICEH|nr:Uma2 family endonuclease [Micromonospora echinofusca]MBO4206422.1 Uma2 family endonuclease [Micromonospora echinofusca]
MAQPSFDWQPPAEGWREDDLLRLPEDGQRYELVDGSLHVTPPADDDHHELADEIRLALRGAAPPGWRVIREIGLRVPAGNLIPDLTVLRPGAPRGVRWHEPLHVALVVEVESPGSRRHDRFTKPALYAEAGIESYWRIERTDLGPAAHLYQRAKIGHYELVGSVGPADQLRVELPFAVTVVPAAWTA